MATLLLICGFCVLLLTGVPVAAAMLAASIAVMVFVEPVPLSIIPTYVVSGINGFELLAVPFFILAAEIMNNGGVTRRIVNAALALVGWMSGALAQVNVVASTIFAGISGAALADLAGLGRLEIKAMTDAGYDLKFSTALTLATCLLGALLPPSIVMIIYAVAAEQSLGKMLLAGVVPGLLVAGALMLYLVVIQRMGLVKFPPVSLPSRRQRALDLVDALPALLAPIIILSGIAFGFVTPTEAAVVACLYCIVVALFIYREMTWSKFVDALRRTIMATSVIMLIIGAAHVFSFIIVRDQGAVVAANWFVALEAPTWVKLIIINLFLFVVGMFIEGVPALLILTPILMPAMQAIGVDPIHFGVILNFNLLIGMLSPPVGIGLFVASNMTGLKVTTVTRAVLPFFIPLGISLALITFVPQLSLALPEWIMQ